MRNEPLLHVLHQLFGHDKPLPTRLYVALVANRRDAAEHHARGKAAPDGRRGVHVDREARVFLEQRDLVPEGAEELPRGLDADAPDALQLLVHDGRLGRGRCGSAGRQIRRRRCRELCLAQEHHPVVQDRQRGGCDEIIVHHVEHSPLPRVVCPF